MREKFLEKIEGIYLRMEGSSGYILQGTRQEIDNMNNAIFRGNCWLGDEGVAEFDCVVLEGGLGVFIDKVVAVVVLEGLHYAQRWSLESDDGCYLVVLL